MIDVTVKIKVAPGKENRALEWAKKIMAYTKKAGLLDSPAYVLRPATGELGEFFFLSRYSSMAEYEEAFGKRRADSGWAAIAKEGTESDWYLGQTRRIFEIIE